MSVTTPTVTDDKPVLPEHVRELQRKFHDRTFGGPDGKPVTIESIQIDLNDEGMPVLYFQTTICSVLKDSYNLEAGADPIEPRAVTLRIDTSRDQAITYKALNRAYNFAGDFALVDEPEAFMRFAQDGENSVYDRIVNAPGYLYLKATVVVKKRTNDSANIYWNPLAIPKKSEFTLKHLRKLKGEVVT